MSLVWFLSRMSRMGWVLLGLATNTWKLGKRIRMLKYMYKIQCAVWCWQHLSYNHRNISVRHRFYWFYSHCSCPYWCQIGESWKYSGTQQLSRITIGKNMKLKVDWCHCLQLPKHWLDIGQFSLYIIVIFLLPKYWMHYSLVKFMTLRWALLKVVDLIFHCLSAPSFMMNLSHGHLTRYFRFYLKNMKRLKLDVAALVP